MSSSTETVVLALPGSETLADGLATSLPAVAGRLEMRPFPDGETYVRVDTPLAGRAVVLAGRLARPDAPLLALWLLAATARDLGARRVGLVAPYLPYSRQDARFRPGEGVTSVYVGRLLSHAIDWLVTVEPHLHRHPTLAAAYDVPATALHAGEPIAAWIGANVERPLVVGPDRESAPGVERIGALAAAPTLVLEKTRRGDRDVRVVVPDVARWRAHTPVIVDDVVSTASTMAEAVRQLRAAGLRAPLCVAVHAVFAGDAERVLADAGAARVVTCDTLAHPTNAIPVLPLITGGVRRHL